jgi:hypothetical protein
MRQVYEATKAGSNFEPALLLLSDRWMAGFRGGFAVARYSDTPKA